MILTALCELADAEGLMEDPNYEPKPVSWIIELSKDGKSLGKPIDTRKTNKQGKPRARKMLVPKVPGRTSGIAAQFLYDKSDYVLGIKFNKETKAFENSSPQLAATIELIEEASNTTEDRGLKAVLSFLRHQQSAADRELALPAEYQPNDWFVFRLEGDNAIVSDRPAVRAWWAQHRKVAEIPSSYCLVSGAPCLPIDKHIGIKRVPGGSTSGVPVVSFNNGAFESYELDGNNNAPIGREVAEKYALALNRLLDPAWPHPKKDGVTLPPRSVRLNDNTTLVYWSASPGGQSDFADLFGEAIGYPDPDVVKRLVSAPKSGKAPFIDDTTAFYALTLSGAQGRATIRDWFTSSVAEFARRIREYFDDLTLQFPFDDAPRPSLKGILRSVVFRGEDKRIPPNLASHLVQAIVRGTPFPTTLLSSALQRCKAEGVLSPNKAGTGVDWNRSHLRLQAIKGYLNRWYRLRAKDSQQTTQQWEITSMLDESNVSPPYLLGRLFCTLELLQSNAQGNTNATIADRYYGAASTAPATVFPRLLNLSKHHMSKLRREQPGRAVNSDKLITQIMGGLPANTFPSVFSMEEQGLFAIGYYHQRQAIFRGNKDQNKC